MKFLSVLESDVAIVAEKRQEEWRNGSCMSRMSPYQASTVEYWRIRFLNKSFIEKLIEEGLTVAETAALIAIGKRIAEIDTELGRVSMGYLTQYLFSVERLHSASFERRLKHLRAEPQLLLEAKAKLREKTTSAVQTGGQ